MTTLTQHLLGILISKQEKTDDFPEKSFYERLAVAAKRENMTTIVFSPEWVNWNNKRAFGFFFDEKKERWLEKNFPLPKIIYDRYQSLSTKSSRQSNLLLKRLRQTDGVLFMNKPLSGKWHIHQLLNAHENLRGYLPKTERYSDFGQLIQSFYDNQRVFLKPVNGTHGLGIFCVSKTADKAYIIQGRVSPTRSICMKFSSEESLRKTIESLIKNRRYILQQALDLTTDLGEVFDIRVLMQKESSESWHVTGSAVRLGAAGTITSNLHSGGHAKETQTFLNQHYNETTSAAIHQQIDFLVTNVPSIIEQHHGRLCELGIDVGVDRIGKVWLIEVNSKPGRKIFEETGLTDCHKLALMRPIHYAQYLMQRKIGG